MPDTVTNSNRPLVAAIACGGTGGHLFPGVAVGRELRKRGCVVTLMISSKEIDRQAAALAGDMEVVTLPGVGLGRSNLLGFVRGFWKSYQVSKSCFGWRPPQFVLAMGGFTAAPPVLAGRHIGAQTYLHEANSIPGRANRWLARATDGAFVYFPKAGEKLRSRRFEVTGMPVRDELLHLPAQEEARRALGLKTADPVLLVMGGSQGAHRINEMVTSILPQLLEGQPRLQFIHLTGADDLESVRSAYATRKCPAVVHPFFAKMELALAAADATVSRAGASSLAEFAACGLPALLIPYPSAADDHQFYNAQAFAQSLAARILPQNDATPEVLTTEILSLLGNGTQRAVMRQALQAWHWPQAAAVIADRMLQGPPSVSSRSKAVLAETPDLGVLNA